MFDETSKEIIRILIGKRPKYSFTEFKQKDDATPS